MHKRTHTFHFNKRRTLYFSDIHRDYIQPHSHSTGRYVPFFHRAYFIYIFILWWIWIYIFILASRGAAAPIAPPLPALTLPIDLHPSLFLSLTLTFWQLLPCLHFAFPQGAMLLPGSALAPHHWHTWTVQTPQTGLLLAVCILLSPVLCLTCLCNVAVIGKAG